MVNSKKIGKLVVTAATSQIPVVGAFAKFFEDYVQLGWQERMESWQNEVMERFSNLDQDMEQKIAETSNFANILATAQIGALGDIEEDKVALYANALVNAIKNENIDDTKRHIFLNMLRDFSILHIEVLKFFSKQRVKQGGFQTKVSIEQATTYDKIIEIEPNLRVGKYLLDMIISDLYNKSMLSVRNLNNVSYQFNKMPKQTTSLADDFLNFISEYESEDE